MSTTSLPQRMLAIFHTLRGNFLFGFLGFALMSSFSYAAPLRSVEALLAEYPAVFAKAKEFQGKDVYGQNYELEIRLVDSTYKEVRPGNYYDSSDYKIFLGYGEKQGRLDVVLFPLDSKGKRIYSGQKAVIRDLKAQVRAREFNFYATDMKTISREQMQTINIRPEKWTLNIDKQEVAVPAGVEGPFKAIIFFVNLTPVVIDLDNSSGSISIK